MKQGFKPCITIPAEQNHLFIEGRYYREQEGYFHICPFTGVGFFGRKNQVYPDEKTKSRAAAALRAERKAPPPEIQKAIIKNEEILKQVYRRSPDKKASLFPLMKNGFDTLVPAHEQININGLKIRFYNYYGYYQFPDNLSIRVFRKTTDYKHYNCFDGKLIELTEEQKKFLSSFGKPSSI